MILKNAVMKANEKYFLEAQTDVDYMNAVMTYYKEYLFVMKMAIGGFQTELNNITRKYANATDDASVLKWAGEIKLLFARKKIIKNPAFDPIEYLAVNYIAGHHGAANWADLA
jgi:hypothetical protein